MFYAAWKLWVNLKMICFQNGDKIVLLFIDKNKNLFSYMWKINRKYWDLMIILSAWVWKSDVLLFLCDLLLCTMKDYVTDQINALTQVQLEEPTSSFGLITGSLRQLHHQKPHYNKMMSHKMLSLELPEQLSDSYTRDAPHQCPFHHTYYLW